MMHGATMKFISFILQMILFLHLTASGIYCRNLSVIPHSKKVSEHIHLKLISYILLPRGTAVKKMENIFYVISWTVILLLVILMITTLKNVGLGEYKLK